MVNDRLIATTTISEPEPLALLVWQRNTISLLCCPPSIWWWWWCWSLHMIWTCASGGCPLLYALHPCCMLFCQQGRWISIYDLVGAIGIDRRSFPCRSLRPKSLVWSTDPSRNGRRTAATRVVWFHRPKFAPDGTQPARRRQGRPGHRFQHRQVCPLLMLLLLLLAHLANWYKQHPREPVCFFPVFPLH